MRKIFLLLLACAGFCSCRRAWTDRDKAEFVSGCINGALREMGETKAKTYCNCMLDKVVRKYPNARDAAYIRYDSAIARMGKDCLKQP
jgi:hypothetical protein